MYITKKEKTVILNYFDKLVPAEIRARGKQAIKIYKEELKTGSMSVVNSRCMFLGKEGAGKTSCVKAMVGERFNSAEQSTDGIVTTTVFQAKKDCSQWKKIKDVNDIELSEQIRSHALGEKVDKRLQEEGNVGTWAKFKNGMYKMVRRKEKVSDITSVWDYAGQLDYYITHRFFLTNTVSYCVAFNVMDNLDEPAKPRDLKIGQLGMTNLDMNLFWIRSIYEHTVSQHGSGNTISIDGKNIESPPICLVATHVDNLSGTASEKEEEVMKMYKKMFDKMEGMPYAHHVDREMYMVDNTMKSPEGITKLKRNVGRYMKEMVREVPVKWVNLQESLQRIGETKLCITFDEVSRIGTECEISKEGLATAIEYMNDIGIILHSSTNKKLKNTVITDLQMMIQMVTKVITVVKPSIKVKQISVLWKRLDEEGMLEERLLRYLWKQQLEEDPHRFEIFTEVMKTFGLLFEKLKVTEGDRVFLVPSRMKTEEESLEVETDKKNMVSIYLTPIDFLPNAVYNTLVVAFLDLMEEKNKDGDQLVSQNRSEFDFKDHGVNLGTVKIENKHALKLEITHLTEVDGNARGQMKEPQPSFCIEVLSYLMHQLETVLVTREGVGYNLCVLCTACNPAEKPHLHDLKKCLKLDTNSVKCGNERMMTNHLKWLFLEDTTTATPLSTSSLETDAPIAAPLAASSLGTGKVNTSQEQFNKLKYDLGLLYIGERLLLLKCCLFEHVDLQHLGKSSCTANYLLNQLHERRYITPTNVRLLLEVAEISQLKDAEDLINQYVVTNKVPNTDEGTKSVSPYRKRLCMALQQFDPHKLNDVIAYYGLNLLSLPTIWELVFHLESNRKLLEESERKRLAELLGPIAERILFNDE
ncbi:uncharacterized protein [Antedon mediterranea]|uniref:uncharacterized protein n=1 Tax=Antedon mediterranea TaxID=105859 RepID=UPI003AF6F8BD